MIFPEDVSAVGHHVDDLFYLALGLTTVAFILVIVIMGYFLIRYRARQGHKAVYTHGDTAKAFGLTVFLALVVFFGIDVNLAIKDHYAWEATWGSIPVGDVVKVEIQPQQFAWNIRYAGKDGEFATEDDIVTINELHIPVNKPVIAALKSKDVIHSFFLPNFRVKQDAVPGMVTSLTFKAVKEGEYDIACAEHCGLGHYRMRGMLTVESEDTFNQWLEQKSLTNTPDVTWGWNWGEG